MPGGNNFDDIIRQALAEGYAKNLRPSEEVEDRRANDPTWKPSTYVDEALKSIERGIGLRPTQRVYPPVSDYELPPEYAEPADTYVRQDVVNPALPYK